MKSIRKIALLTTLVSMFSQATTHADAPVRIRPKSSPKLARDDARKIAVQFRAQGYEIFPIATGDNKHAQVDFTVDINKGVDYVFMVGIDEAIGAVDLYVKDESGNMIAQDTTDRSRACVDFAASYNGTVTVIVDPLRNDPDFPLLGHFALLAGGQESGL
ncbi:MAG: hypothetical protein ABL949_16370 [Fimbriimonadaceae bacterium]